MDASKATKLQQQLADITKKSNEEEEKCRQAKAKLEDALQTQNPPPPPDASTNLRSRASRKQGPQSFPTQQA
ncbi:hypothetical protein PTTG_04211 [Puccinia triticina 1-1 BBBD Race 1]|uniref:Uncharacterized protein n=1 Tax=Puccinia triticina (isolate 1-1 / race 1 (BBBD)) TaxID=630390 RepID=A0A180GRU3_PUCT1|nr:hypothetical protein PTTG_04211 [Puccinia triticina 1-1 BBBD Race 1]